MEVGLAAHFGHADGGEVVQVLFGEGFGGGVDDGAATVHEGAAHCYDGFAGTGGISAGDEGLVAGDNGVDGFSLTVAEGGEVGREAQVVGGEEAGQVKTKPPLSLPLPRLKQML